jgi:hypothetical protein
MIPSRSRTPRPITVKRKTIFDTDHLNEKMTEKGR